MSDLQKRFDGLLALLHDIINNDALAAECYATTEGEVAFTAPAENAPLPTAKTMAEILELNLVNEVNATVLELIGKMNQKHDSKIAVWYIDSDNGQYVIATNPQMDAIVGIAKTGNTLTNIRKKYFLQKEALEKIGETLPFDYGKAENSFFNRKLIA